MTKFVVATALLMLVAYVGGQALGRRGDADDTGASQAGAATAASGSRAPDISNMSPEERATRLFDRVMAYSEQGKMDSARFFAPMAITAYQMIGPLDAHARYDIGTISAAVGETALARQEADSILAHQPNNLLGLTLAIRTSTMAGDANAAAKFRQRLIAAAPAERAKNLKEYTEHASDIDRALGKP
jgi:predicted Zn-dependent protease